MSRSPARLSVEAGRVIYEQGAAPEAAYLVLTGTVELQRAGLAPLGRTAGEMFGERALVDDSDRQDTAVARTDCTLLAVTSDHLTDRLAGADPLLRIAVGMLAARYSEAAGHARQEPQPPPAVLPVWGAEARAAHEVLSFEHELRAGLERGELMLFYQPIVRLSTGRLAGFEALVRWQHPRRGLLGPADFIDLAEASGVISDITMFGLRRVGAEFPRLQEAAGRNPAHVERLFVSVNVSGIDLEQSAFAARAVSTLCDAGVAPEDVRLEVTESILMKDAKRCAETLRNCRDQGIGIAIDDFGTGYSSLHYLNALPITVLKMDRSFCRSMLSDAGGRTITGAILHLGRDLGLSVIAEGIETAAQSETLRAMGCDLGQGYLFSPPLSHARTLDAVARWTAPQDRPAAAAMPSPAA